MPDFFLGKPLPKSSYPPDTDEKKKEVGAFFGGPASPPDTAKKVPQLLTEIEKQATGIKKWGSLGMCWGGKVRLFPIAPAQGLRTRLTDPVVQIVSLTAQPGTPFSAVAEVHPAMVDPSDAKGIHVPLCMLASGDEDAQAVKDFSATLTVDKHIETFGDQVHGWMAARGNLEDERVRKEYERGYQVLLDFYHKHL